MRTGAPKREPARPRAPMPRNDAPPRLDCSPVGSPQARLAAAVQSVVHVRPQASGGAQDHHRRRSPSLAVVLVGGGALWWRLASGPIMLDLVTPWLTVGDRAESRQPLSRRGRRHAARARRTGAHGVASARHRAARRLRRHGRGGAQGRGRHFRNEPAVRKPARRKLPPGRCQHDDPHRSRWAGQCAGRRRAAVRHDRAGTRRRN